MTDISAVLEKVYESLTNMLTNGSPAPEVQHFDRTQDPRQLVEQWPPAHRWITYPNTVDPIVIGATMGPMLPMEGVKEPVLYTVVAVDGNRAGLAYGLWRIA